MTERKLFLSPQVYQTLHAAQLDAIELAALDCSYSAHRMDPASRSTDSLMAEINENKANVLLLTSQECATFLDRQKLEVHRPDPRLPKGIALVHTGEGRFDPFKDGSLSPQVRYMLGATTPVILRGLVGSMLEFQIGIGHRGVLPRIATAQGIEAETRLLKSSSERSNIQEFVAEYTKSMGRKFKTQISSNFNHYAKALTDILDELLMNAIWDSNPEFKNKSRTEDCILANGKEVTIECSCDGVNLALAVEDKHGTFPWVALFGPQSFALGAKPPLRINEGPGGAGLGLYMVLQKTSILSFEIKKDAYTRVTAILRLDESARDMQARPKTLLVFSDDMYTTPATNETNSKHNCSSN